jgi:UDP:flavonoid glycosyltransferase YjiC (YdhE family)
MRYLFTTLPSNDLGLLTRSLPIAAELVKQGHQIAFCSPAPAPSRITAEAGFDNLLPKHPLYYLMAEKASLRGLGRAIKRWRQDDGNPARFLGQLLGAIPTKIPPIRSEIWDMDHFGAIIGLLNEGFVRANCDALVHLMTNWQPDVVVDFWNPFACIAARALQKPLVTVIQADMHPQSRGFLWWKTPPPDRPTATPVLNQVLAAYDLPPIERTAELFVGDLTLVVGMPETDPLPEEADATYIGPLLWQKPGAELPAWVDSLRKDKPIIWLYPGNPRYMPVETPTDSGVVLRACIAALADEDIQVVLSMGHHDLPKEVLPLPANFYHTPFVPGLAMAERCDLLIHHGGYGSCQTGLYTGTPAVIVPTYSERESNARRVAAVGAGDFVIPTSDPSGRKKQVPIEEVRTTVWRVLSNPTFTENAQRISEKMRTYGGAVEAARLIEALV